MPKRPTQKFRASDKLITLGWNVADVERIVRNGPITRRFDCFGLFDVIAIKGRRTLGLQITDTTGVSAHVEKMLSIRRLWDVLAAGWEAEVWGVRNRRVRDGSFAVVRQFKLDRQTDRVTTFNYSSVL